MKSRVLLFEICLILVAACATNPAGTAPPDAAPQPEDASTTAPAATPTSPAVLTTGRPSVTTAAPEPLVTTSMSAPATSVSTTAPAVVTEADVNAALVAYLLDRLAATSYGGTPFCGHYLYGFDQADDNVSAYLYAWCHEYYVEDGVMEMGTALGTSALVEMGISTDGLTAYSHEMPGDGEGRRTAADIFPQHIVDALPAYRGAIVPDQPLTQAANHFGARPERTLPATATCRQVQDANLLYAMGVMYWLREGRPISLDADGDGRPCEDQYASHLVERYYDPTTVPVDSGLLCHDLDAAGVDFENAIGYWLAEERPDRMDVDRNGVPCETVYDGAEIDRFFADVRGEASGQFCRDLEASGHRFGDTVAYWLLEDMPDRMDADRNGVPCETVFDVYEVGNFISNASTEIDSGLFCRDLVDRGWPFPSAVRYWMLEGMPDRMDADGNAIPCETVYDRFEIDDWIEFDRVWLVD